MKKYTTILVLGLVFFVSAGSAFAQVIPGQLINPWQPVIPGQIVPVQAGYSLQTVPVVQAWTYYHKTPIAIQGNIVQFYGGRDLYIFRDSSGDILVKIGSKELRNLMFQGISIDADDTVEIYGEVHWPRHSYGAPEVHVRYINKS
ncbi:MAG: NirD/YgiW/YdeI family stress tolerance protein [Treponema sp.]|nr:NirD/YgiW/YdeI family stress tolerance protein [Treponema sp.]